MVDKVLFLHLCYGESDFLEFSWSSTSIKAFTNKSLWFKLPCSLKVSHNLIFVVFKAALDFVKLLNDLFEKITKKRTVKYFLFLPILFFLLMPRAPKPLLLNLILNNITFFFCNCAVSNFLMISGTKSRGQKFKFGL